MSAAVSAVWPLSPDWSLRSPPPLGAGERPAQARAGRSAFTSARALGGELLHRVGVRLVHEPGSGEHGQTAAHRVGVRVEQRQEDDRQVTLEVLLLVDG